MSPYSGKRQGEMRGRGRETERESALSPSVDPMNQYSCDFVSSYPPSPLPPPLQHAGRPAPHARAGGGGERRGHRGDGGTQLVGWPALLLPLKDSRMRCTIRHHAHACGVSKGMGEVDSRVPCNCCYDSAAQRRPFRARGTALGYLQGRRE